MASPAAAASRAGSSAAPVSAERMVSTRATVSGEGARPRSARSRVRKRENECSAPARSPTAARRRRSACWASSETGSSHTRRRAHTTATDWSPAASELGGYLLVQLVQHHAVRLARLVQPFLLDSGCELGVGELTRLLRAARIDQTAELVHVDGRIRSEPERGSGGDERFAPERIPERPDRRPQAAPRALVEHLGPEERGDPRPCVLARVERQPDEERRRLAARRQADAGAVALDAHVPEQGDPDRHESEPSRVPPALTMR